MPHVPVQGQTQVQREVALQRRPLEDPQTQAEKTLPESVCGGSSINVCLESRGFIS